MQQSKGLLAKFGICFLLGFLALVFTAQALADSIDDARRRGKLLAGVKADFPPFGTVESNGTYT
ncbi:MAG: hypothetical protein HGA63_01170, partial [Syntrophobacteraceae bacterium]|nr:hypothetical protein [Syntrophobacteraceae bacterium]